LTRAGIHYGAPILKVFGSLLIHDFRLLLLIGAAVIRIIIRKEQALAIGKYLRSALTMANTWDALYEEYQQC